jgi:hypothetical protein
MIELGKSDLERWLEGHLDELCQKSELWTQEELLKEYNPEGRKQVNTTGIGVALKNAGVLKRQVSVSGRNRLLYAIKDKDRWSVRPNADWAAEYLSRRS